MVLHHLLDLVHPYVPIQPLRSQESTVPSVPKVWRKTVGERAFSFRAPTLWNSLPLDIRQACLIEVFKIKLKTHLFTTVYET